MQLWMRSGLREEAVLQVGHNIRSCLNTTVNLLFIPHHEDEKAFKDLQCGPLV